ncbi:hypothetical protein [Sulfurospirillum sp. 1612]
MDIIHDLAIYVQILTPLVLIPLFKLQQTLTEIKIDIAKLKQKTGVN